ncbi:kinesin family protein [Candidatus Dependentiae bacterium]|nr:kinesin family protein [Candidatus Dependentiae bacterium]
MDGQATPDSSPIRPGLTANGDAKTPTASPSQQANSHVPYRDSKLTFLLQVRVYFIFLFPYRQLVMACFVVYRNRWADPLELLSSSGEFLLIPYGQLV